MTAYKDEKTNTWMARFYYTDWKGARKQKKKRGFEKKKDALAYEADFMARAEQKTTHDLEGTFRGFSCRL